MHTAQPQPALCAYTPRCQHRLCSECVPTASAAVIHNVSSTDDAALQAAPEVLNRGYYSRACDVWGFGILAHKLLSGSEPFSTLSEVQQAKGSATMDAPEWDSVSDLAKDFVRTMLERNPADRPSIQQARACRSPCLPASPLDSSL